MSDYPEFFKMFEGLDRVGPGCADDVSWAFGAAGIGAAPRILDAGSGPGGDIGDLRRAAPDGTILAIDTHPPFITRALARFGDDPGIRAEAGDMLQVDGVFDLIWCAGAIYFVGVTRGLGEWRTRLAPGGVVVFSQICRFGKVLPGEVKAMFDGVDVLDKAGIGGEVAAAGYEVLATRELGDAAWEGYYQPLETRVAALRPAAGEGLRQALDETEAEIATWRRYRREFGYLLCVVRPVA